MTFLKELAESVFNRYEKSLRDVAVIFPSRRAGMYFRSQLALQMNSPQWSPPVFAIEDFVISEYKGKIADNLTLIFELYKIYNKYLQEPFENFYPWGEMLLRDFDTVDKYYADTTLLFRNIRNIKEIEENFPAEIKQEFIDFWSSVIDMKSDNEARNDFIKIWEKMENVYDSYVDTLEKQGIAYEGMAYRSFADKVLSGNYEPLYKKYIFAGFNNLTKCEEIIFSYFEKSGLGEFQWDADKYYIDNNVLEAGKFIRKNIKLFGKGNSETGDSLITERKKISVIGAAHGSGTAKAAGKYLSEIISSGNFIPEKTAVVLPDDSMLLPVLYSIPKEIKDINISMGLPFRTTPLYNLILLLKNLQKNSFTAGNGVIKFNHKDISKILLHPYIKFYATDLFFAIVRTIKKYNINYIDIDSIFDFEEFRDEEKPLVLNLIFKYVNTVRDINDYIRSISADLIDKLESTAGYNLFQTEYVYNLLLSLNRLEDTVIKSGITIEPQTYWTILMRILENIKITFRGEPLKGLQVMGLLETRAIDFDNVFILSANEGVLPGGKTYNSFIPYSLRKAFRMPVYEDNDAVTAYNFYRLIQRAKNIFIFYDTETGENVKEKSRFILQTEYELANQGTNIDYAHKIISPPLKIINPQEIYIDKKNTSVTALLKELDYIPVTRLSLYVNCPLQFYLSFLLKLDEEETVEEVLSPALFGSLFHSMMKIVYEESGKTFKGETDIELLYKSTEKNFNEIFDKVINSDSRFREMDFTSKGRNLLFKSIIKKLVLRLLESEKQSLPYQISAIEKKTEIKIDTMFLGERKTLRIGGRIDRTDLKDDAMRVLDYKTGGGEIKHFKTKDFWHKLFTSHEFKDSLQVLIYSYMFKSQTGKDILKKGIMPGIISLRNIEKNVMYIKETPLDDNDYALIESGLKSIVDNIFNVDIPFTKTDDENRCKYCSFKSLCSR